MVSVLPIISVFGDESSLTISEKVGDTTITITYPPIKAKGKKTWKDIVTPGKNWLVGDDNISTITFEEDVKINGLRLNSGTYGFYVYVVDEDDWQFVFNSTPVSDTKSYDRKNDMIRIAVLNKEEKNQKQLKIGLENVITSKRSTKADFVVHLEKKKAAVALETTGERRNLGLEPELPSRFEPAWSKVLESLQALVAEEFEAHTKDFSDDFDTDFGDGADKDGHIQFLDNIARGGLTDDMGLNCEAMDFEEDGDVLRFTNLQVYSKMGTINMTYSLSEIDGKWMITYLSTEE